MNIKIITKLCCFKKMDKKYVCVCVYFGVHGPLTDNTTLNVLDTWQLNGQPNFPCSTSFMTSLLT